MVPAKAKLVQVDASDREKPRQRPLYMMLIDTLRQRTSSGELPLGAQIPSEAQLMKEFDLSRVTVRQALAVLQKEGLIVRKQGRGTFVASPHFEQKLSRGARTIVEALNEAGIKPEVRVLGMDHIKLPAKVLEAFNDRDAEDGVQLRRLYLHDGVPIALVTLYLPLPMSGVAYILAQDANLQETVYSIFEQQMGISIKEAKYTVKTVPLDDADAYELGMQPNDICLNVDRVSYSEKGAPLEMMTYVYPPGRMQFEITLPRHSVEQAQTSPITTGLASRTNA